MENTGSGSEKEAVVVRDPRSVTRQAADGTTQRTFSWSLTYELPDRPAYIDPPVRI